ncbi:ROK family protein [Thermaerobacter composti]|nr:ROK family protein [Thermaerobacter composti]
MEPLVMGIDIGGTNVVLAAADAKRHVVAERVIPTRAVDGPDGVLDRIAREVERLLTELPGRSRLAGIGVGVPGLVSSTQGLSRISPNLGWRDVNVAEYFHRRFGVPTWIDNDVRVATLGEHVFGAGRGLRNFICVTLGTGVGAGIVLDGQLYVGVTESAGEIGHLTVEKEGLPCGCGNRGCLEQYASGRAIARRAQERLREGVRSSLWTLVDGAVDRVTAKHVAAAFAQGDDLAREVLTEAAEYLAIGLAGAIHLFNPERIIVGGGVSLAGEPFLELVRQAVGRRVWEVPLSAVSIVRAELGDRSGVMGAAALALRRLSGAV